LQLAFLRRRGIAARGAAVLQAATVALQLTTTLQCATLRCCVAAACVAAALHGLLRRCTGCCNAAAAPGAASGDITALQQLAVLRRSALD
jgi:hypothetical protein